MGLFGTEFKQLLKDAFQNFIAALVIVILAAGFAMVEKYCANAQFPEYFVFGAHLMAVALFIIDGIVVIATAAILGCKIISRQMNKK